MKTLLASFLLCSTLATTWLEDGELTPRVIESQESAITQLGVSQAGDLLISSNAKGGMQAWDLEANELRWSRNNVRALHFSVGTELIAHHPGMAVAGRLGVEDGEIHSGIAALTATQNSECIAATPDDTWIWVGTDQGILTRLTPGDANAWSNRNLKNGGVKCLAMDAKGNTLAAGGQDGTVRFGGAKSATIDKKKLIEGKSGPVLAIAVDSKLKQVVTGHEKGILKVWKAKSCKLKKALEAHSANITRLAMGPKGKRLVSGDSAGVICVWDLAKGEVLRELKLDSSISGLVWLDRGKSLAASCTDSTKITVWDL